MAVAEAPTLLSRIGGDGALDATVEEFYTRLLKEPSLQIFFEGADLSKLKRHQFNFMRMAFTKIPQGTNVANMIYNGHKRLITMGLNETHFDTVAGVLVGTLKDMGVKDPEVDEVVSIVGPLRDVFKDAAIRFKAEQAAA